MPLLHEVIPNARRQTLGARFSKPPFPDCHCSKESISAHKEPAGPDVTRANRVEDVGSRVFLLDDETLVLRSVKRLLESRGHEVRAFPSCSHALADQEHYDIAVLDIDLPDGSGVDVGRMLLDSGRAQAVVFFSGNTRVDVHQLGPIILKPDTFALLDAVEGRLRTSRSGSKTKASHSL